MSGASAIGLVLDALRAQSDGVLLLEPAQQQALAQGLLARATLESAEHDASDVIRFAAFLGVDKNSPAAALGVLAALSPLLLALSERNTSAGQKADAQLQAAQQLLGTQVSVNALQGEGIFKAAKKGALEAELSQRFAAESARARPRGAGPPIKKPRL